MVVVRLADRVYAFPIHTVVEVVRMVAITPLPEAPAVMDGVINLRGRTVPVVSLSRRLGLPPPPYDPESYLLVVGNGRQMLAIPVDEVLDVRPVPEVSLVIPQVAGAEPELLAGVAELGEDQLLVLDPDALFTLETLLAIQKAESGAEVGADA